MLTAPRRPENRTIPHQSGICDTDECRCVLSHPSASRGQSLRSHARSGPRRATVGLIRGFRRPGQAPAAPSREAWVYHTTQTPPWKARERRRARNRAARLSRRRNRR
jgi:hypothetical protein